VNESTWSRRGVLSVAVGVVVLCGLDPLAARRQGTGTIHGIVTVDLLPEKKMLTVTADQEICGDEVEDRAMVVDPSGGVANAIIIVPSLPWLTDPPAPIITNKSCYFEPRVQVAKTRSQVELRSEDDTLHTTHAYDDRQRTLFNIAIPAPGINVKRRLQRPGPVRIECDSHGWMRGWVYVTGNVGVVTSSDGRFELTGIPTGTYELTIWHERYEGSSEKVTVTSGGTTEANFVLE